MAESSVHRLIIGNADQGSKEAKSALLRQAETKQFRADTAGNARRAAGAWLSDFNSHDPLTIKSIRTTVRGKESVAIITYWRQ